VDEVTGNTSPLVFDQEISHTYLATVNINDIVGNDITFNDGSVHIIANRFNISGTVSYDGSGRAVPDAILGLTHSEGTGNETTDSNGEYLFEGILACEVELVPSKDGDLKDAITGSDALLVLQYLAFLATLDDDQQFAADVTEDGNVTGSDAQAILRYLAFYTDNIGATGQWSFIPSDTSFTLQADAVADFKAYLKGDANLDWNEGADLSKTGASNTVLKIGEVDAADAKIVSVPLSIEAAGETLNTFVFSLSYDDACLRYIGIDKTNLTNEFMLVANGDEKGKIHVAMAGVKGVAADGSILNLNFEVIDPAQSSRLEVTRAFINDLQVVNFENGRINHNETKLTAIPDRFNLEQNYPNPFNPETRIAFQLPVASFVVVKIYNVMGDEIGILVNEKKEAGCHQLTWDGKNSLGDEVPSGMYIISFQAGEFRMNRKMLKIQ